MSDRITFALFIYGYLQIDRNYTRRKFTWMCEWLNGIKTRRFVGAFLKSYFCTRSWFTAVLPGSMFPHNCQPHLLGCPISLGKFTFRYCFTQKYLHCHSCGHVKLCCWHYLIVMLTYKNIPSHLRCRLFKLNSKASLFVARHQVLCPVYEYVHVWQGKLMQEFSRTSTKE
jgi:hypothetical protein